jgi:predicted transcriptional regulator
MPEPVSASYMILIVGVMIISGALGGIVSALVSARDDRLCVRLMIKHTVIGMVAALTAPLLLNMLSSDILESGQTRPLKLLTLIGLCVIFAVFSTRFLERIFGSPSKDEGRYGQEVSQRRDQPDRTEEKAVKVMPVSSPDKGRAAENQSKILQALAGAEDARLTLADLMRSAEISQKDFDETLSLLMAKGAVAQVLSSGNKLQLVLTARGRQQLNRASAN